MRLSPRSRLFAKLPGDLPETFWWLWLGTLLNRAGAFVIPLLAIYLTRERGLGSAHIGTIIAAFGVGSVLAGLVGGVLADRVGRRATMTLSLACGGGVLGAIGFIRGPELLAPAMLLFGFVGEMYRPAVFASVADLVAEDRRTTAYAYLYWAVNLGFAVAPLLGGLLAQVSFTACFLIDGTSMLLFAALIFARVPETGAGAGAGAPDARPSAGLGDVLRDRPFMGFALANLLIAITVWGSMVVLPLQMSGLGHSPAAFGVVTATNGALIVVLQPVLTRWIARKRTTHVLVASAVLFAGGFGMNALVTGVAGFMLAVAVWTIGEIIASPVLSATVAGMAPPTSRGRYHGVFATSFSLAAALGPLGGGRLIAPLGFTRVWTGTVGLGLAAALIFAIVGPACERRVNAARSIVRTSHGS